MVSVTCADILELLRVHKSLSTREISDRIGCLPKRVWPTLRTLEIRWIRKTFKFEGRKKIVYWSLSAKAKKKLENYNSFYDMPWSKKIEERMKAKGLEYKRFWS